MFTLLLTHDVGRELVLQPVRVGAAIGPYVNWLLIALTAMAVSISRKRPGAIQPASQLPGLGGTAGMS